MQQSDEPTAEHPPIGPGDVPSPPVRRRHHPLLFLIGFLIVVLVIGGAAAAIWSLYSDTRWRADARDDADGVALAIRGHSLDTGQRPRPVDAVASNPDTDQTLIADLPYADEIPSGVARFRLSTAGSLSVLTASQALCSGVTMDLDKAGVRPSGAFGCGDPLPPPQPTGLTATPRDESVILDWTMPPGPVEDFIVQVSSDGGENWRVVEDGASARTDALVRSLTNGNDYRFSVAAVNLISESRPAFASAAPFTHPSEPRDVRAEGGMDAVVTWQPPLDDGGRPVTGYLVTGNPSGSCFVPATETRCEFTDLGAAPGYSFIVRAVNEAGAGEPNFPEVGPVKVFTAPGPPVAISASPGDRVVLLTWYPPLRNGNTPITDYRVEYREAGTDVWRELARDPSTETAAAVPGLVNGTTYEFSVRAVNEAGESGPPLSMPRETPATVPTVVTAVERVIGDQQVTLTWGPPEDDGSAAVLDYVVQYRAEGGDWNDVDDEVGPQLERTVTGLTNGTRYAFRVAAQNRIGRGPWSRPIQGRPVGPPGPVTEVESVGWPLRIVLTWEPPENDGGRELVGYRVDYRPTEEKKWIQAGDVKPDVTTATIGGLTQGEAYDIRIVALNEVGAGPTRPGPRGEGPNARPTLVNVIADQTPPPPAGLTAVAGDRMVTLTWDASRAGAKSPITAYTVTGTPEGECVVKKLSCVIKGLTNGVTYSFTVHAENENIVGEESEPVTATPLVYNDATGGEVSWYVDGDRTFRVHTFTQGGTFTVTSADQPFSVLVVGGGGGSAQAPGGPLYPGAGGGVIDAPRIKLPLGTFSVGVGAGGPAGKPGGPSSFEPVGAAPAGPAGSATQTEFTSPVKSDITGKNRVYGRSGRVDSGQGKDGQGGGGGGPTPNRGGNGIVVISYEVPE